MGSTLACSFLLFCAGAMLLMFGVAALWAAISRSSRQHDPRSYSSTPPTPVIAPEDGLAGRLREFQSARFASPVAVPPPANDPPAVPFRRLRDPRVEIPAPKVVPIPTKMPKKGDPQ